MTKLESIEQLEEFIADNPACIILKHSTACPISGGAYREFCAFDDAGPIVPLAVVFILDTRSVSNHLAELTGIEHKSPQALFFSGGKCYRSISHYEITADSLSKGLEG